MPNPGASPFCSRCASVALGAATGAGNSQMEPSVKTPSTSNRIILIFLARSRDMKRLTLSCFTALFFEIPVPQSGRGIYIIFYDLTFSTHSFNPYRRTCHCPTDYQKLYG